MARLTQEEREIVKAFEQGDLRSSRHTPAIMTQHREYAAATFRKDKRVNVRISSRDLDALRKRALSEGIPYQTLIASVLHRFVEGRLRAPEAPE